MDQCEDREEGVPPSKTTLCGEHENQTKAQRNQPGPGPSCVSLKSDQSKADMIAFKVQPLSAAERVDQESSEVPSSQSAQQHQTDLDSIFMLLEDNIIIFIKNELKKIQKVLSPDYPTAHHSQMEDDERKRSNSEAFLKITLDFLRRMKQVELANRLLSRIPMGGLEPNLKSFLKKKFQCVSEGIAKSGKTTLLNQIYTELYIIEGGTAEVNDEHEVRQIETASRKIDSLETTIGQEDIFKASPGRDKPIRTVLTKGVAGIGKTFLTQNYINFCVDTVVPKKTFCASPTISPDIKDIKATLNKKKRAFRNGDRDQLKLVQKELKAKIAEGKVSYRRKLENKLQENNTREVWNGMRAITGLRQKRGVGMDRDVESANNLNLHFNRFDCPASPVSTPSSSHLLLSPPPSPAPSDCLTLSLSADDIKRELGRLHSSKAAGPDGVSPRALRCCASQLSGVLHRIFNMSLVMQRVPSLWKTSCLVPVPKKINLSTLGDYRPVALTSHVMKTLERLILKHLRLLVEPWLDPLQFAYQPRISVENAIIYLLDQAYSHLDIVGSTVRVMFFDFSSAFNTIRPSLLGNKLTEMQVDAPLKFSDDSAIVGCIRDEEEEEYRSVVDSFVEWCELNHLQLNITKTKELIMDFRKQAPPPNPVTIRGADVEIVEDYRYLGLFFNLEVGIEISFFSSFVYVYSNLLLSQILLFRLDGCNLSGKSCAALSSVVNFQSSSLRELDLSNNDLQDLGVKLFSEGLKDPHCKLESLSLSGCLITEEGCTSLASALSSNPSHLRELDLSYNHPGDSGINLLLAGLKDPCWRLDTLRVEPAGVQWLTPGLKKYSCQLTIDTNTVHTNLQLSDNYRTVTHAEEVQSYPDHGDRFDVWPQLLCSNELTGRCYWEVEWSGRVDMSVSYRRIRRKGDSYDCVFGYNDQSWSLNCTDNGPDSVCHANSRTSISSSSVSNRVAVYVDCPAGTLSFYRVSSDTLIHLHTFNNTFTELLYPAFYFFPCASVRLC
ncbi:uncharacterized protein LOC120738979 [Simochromis diagramma]|uniref:uncharacterized protein LOC120738979 n=1 Tax=Simochromis diagramma TaxID=43689 RepID=UPI001A7EA70D|nr:uncharacterized protein LOC120738979 [Simochromis diagramma]